MSAISDLPTDPIGVNTLPNNITMTTTELPSYNPQIPPPASQIIQPQTQQTQQTQQQANFFSQAPQIPPSQIQQTLDQETISQIINGIQQASLSGSTLLPSRDIPMSSDAIKMDRQARPNFIPEVPSEKLDYLKMQDLIEEKNATLNKYSKQQQINNSLDKFYNTIQMPLLVGLLYFIFQLPIVKNITYKYIPLLFSSDGNYNLTGYIVISITFAFVYHILQKLITFIQ